MALYFAARRMRNLITVVLLLMIALSFAIPKLIPEPDSTDALVLMLRGGWFLGFWWFVFSVVAFAFKPPKARKVRRSSNVRT